MWIFGRASRDLLWLFIPGFVFVLAARAVAPENPAYLPLAFLALSLVDSGHGYTTALRTYWDREEFASRRAYWLAPLAIFATLFAWAWLGIPYLWTAILYTTVFHHLRQFYGIVRWYEKLNGRADRPSHFFSHALTATPIVLYHFNPGTVQGHFQGFEMLAYSNPLLWHAGLIGYVLLVAAWAGRETWLWRARGIREPNRVAALALPGALIGVCFLGGRTQAEVVFPIVIAHGVAYFALLGLSLKRLGRFPALPLAIAVVAAFSFAFGALEYLYEQNLLEIDYLTHGISALGAAVLAFYVTPSICHYLFDAWLWKGNHRQAKTVFARESNTKAT